MNNKKSFSLLFLLLVCLSFAPVLKADDSAGRVLTIADPFIELHTGPGPGYPIFHVIDRGAEIEVLMRKTQWYRIRSSTGIEGWVDRDQLQQTLTPGGSQLQLSEFSADDFEQRDWELVVTTGELEDAPVISVAGAYAFTKNLAAELGFSHSVGTVSSSTIPKTNLLMQPLPEWSYSPFFTLGFGRIQVKPSATLVDPADRNNNLGQIGFGFKKFLSRQFVLRAEINQYVIFSASNERDDNEEIGEWKLGFAVFF